MTSNAPNVLAILREGKCFKMIVKTR